MTKPGCQSRLYVGSGTNTLSGVKARLLNYKPGGSPLPKLVCQAFKNGYTIEHKGLLCWTKMPQVSLRPTSLVRFLLIESYFTIVFNACIPMVSDVYIEDFSLWPRDSVTWGPLCSHLPLSESLRLGLDLTPEQLEDVERVRRARALEVANRASVKFRAKRRAVDPEGFKAHTRESKRAWSQANAARLAARSAQNRENTLALETWYCHDCNRPFQSLVALASHLGTQAHRDNVAGIPKAPLSAKAVANKVRRDAIKATSRYVCTICGTKPFDSQTNLDRHQKGSRHIAKAAKAAKVQDNVTGASAPVSE